MSLRISTLVWQSARASGSDLVMLLAIADFANDGGVAYPSVATLAKKARMQERNARYVLGRLAESGELRIQPNAGPRGCNLFRITIDQPLQEPAPLQVSAPLQPASVTPAGACTESLQRVAPEPSLNRQEPLLKPLSGRPDVVSPSEEVLAYLNQRVGRSYRPVPANLSLIRARLESGASIEQCRLVIDAKATEWEGEKNMSKFLRPATLFGLTKFEQYVGDLGPKKIRTSAPDYVLAGYGSADEMARAMEHA